MKYYIAENGQPAGPFEMIDLLKHGLNPNSQVWNEKMSGWTRASEVPELMNMLGIQQPIAPQPAQPVQPVQPQSSYAPQQPEQSPYAPQQPEQSPYAPQQPEQSPATEQTAPTPANGPQASQPQGYGQEPSPYAQPQYQQVQQPQQPQYQQQPYGQQPYGQQPYGQPYAPQSFPQKNWMTESIIFTVLSVICCCNPIALITGIIAIVNAGKVNGMYASCNVPAATESAKSAKMWALITLGILIVGAIISAVAFMLTPGVKEAFMDGYENGYNPV